MNKKFVSVLLSSMIMMLFTVSCKETPEPEEIIGEPVISEYTMHDVKNITVPLTYSENPAPIEFNEFEVPDFGKRKPACGMCEQGIYEDENLSEECDGRPLDYTINGDYAYFSVFYSHYGSCSHENSIFRYNIKTKELKEIYIHSDAVETEHLLGLVSIGTKLYAIDYAGNEEIVEIDTETGEKKCIYNEPMYYLNSFGKADDVLVVVYFEPDEDSNSGMYIQKKYDPETGEWHITDKLRDDLVELYRLNANLYDNEVKCAVRKSDDGRNIVFDVENYFTLSLKKRNVWLIGADEKSILWTESVDYVTYNELYINNFNSETMEICTVKFDRDSISAAKIGNGCLVVSGPSGVGGAGMVHYLLPELGLAFEVAGKGDYSFVKQEGGIVSFYESDNDLYNGFISKKIYWYDKGSESAGE